MEYDSKYNLELNELALLLDALSHPARLQIVSHLASYRECPAGSICEILPISNSTVSQHLTKLKKAGLIVCNPSGNCQNYNLNEDKINQLETLVCDFLYMISSSVKDRKECKMN